MARQAKWDWALSHEQIVFARVSPAHKLLIVENCQRRGESELVSSGCNSIIQCQSLEQDVPTLRAGSFPVVASLLGIP